MTKPKRTRERSAEVGSGLPASAWCIEPSWWRQAMGGADDAGWLIIDHTCDECRKRRGCHIVTGDPTVEEGVLYLCTRCLVADHGPVWWKVTWNQRLTRRRIERAREHDAEVEAMAGHRVE